MPALKELRLARGKTVREVALEIGMSERHLRRLESGEVTLRGVLARAFSEYYGVPVDQITARPAA